MKVFDRIISIDWSGAGAETERVKLRIAHWERSTNECRIQLPPTSGSTRNWRRSECRQYLREMLCDGPRTLIGIDAGLSLPWGADEAVFSVRGWRQMISRVSHVYSEAGTARAAAQRINSQEHLEGHGPYRFNEGRTDFRFYLDHGVAYYRATELAAPQAISQWYLGSGGTVGFHTITALSAIDWLIAQRERHEVRFSVWPFEAVADDAHVIVETYPSICPKCPKDPSCIGSDEHDAWKVLQMLVQRNTNGSLAELFRIREQRFGRISGIDFEMQVAFEGLIFGLSQ